MQELRDSLLRGNNGYMLWCGDFNQHHPLWDRDKDNQLFTVQAPRDTGPLIEMVVNKGLEMILPKGKVMLKHMVTNQFSRQTMCGAAINWFTQWLNAKWTLTSNLPSLTTTL
jgi:hypothetical protein